MVYVHSMPQDLVDYAIPQPEMIIASDAIPYVDGKAHPRGAGILQDDGADQEGAWDGFEADLAGGPVG